MTNRRFRPSLSITFIARNPLAAWLLGLLIALLLAVPLPAVPQAPPGEGVIQSETNIVLVNVVAKDKHGKPIRDLGRDDFVLLDNHQEQKIAQWDTFISFSNQPYNDYTKQVRATRTAEALQTIAGHLQGISGRKTLIWISGGFPIQTGLGSPQSNIPQSTPNNRPAGAPSRLGGSGGGGGGSGGGGQSTLSNLSTPPPQMPYSGLTFQSDVDRAIRALNEADVAVYPVDARGVTTPTPFQADRSSIGKWGQMPKAVAPPDFNYDTLETLAVETGGLAFHHINDLNTAIHEAASDGKVSYSLAFYPQTGSLDGSYHRLEVAVNRPGYVAARDTAVAVPLPEAITNPISLAGIGFSVHLDPAEGGYRAAVTIDPRNITLQPKDGKWMGTIQFLVGVGKVEHLTTIPLNFPEATFHQIQDKGLILGANVKTPPGTMGFSLGFRDVPSGLVGTLHVPL